MTSKLQLVILSIALIIGLLTLVACGNDASAPATTPLGSASGATSDTASEVASETSAPQSDGSEPATSVSAPEEEHQVRQEGSSEAAKRAFEVSNVADTEQSLVKEENTIAEPNVQDRSANPGDTAGISKSQYELKGSVADSNIAETVATTKTDLESESAVKTVDTVTSTEQVAVVTSENELTQATESVGSSASVASQDDSSGGFTSVAVIDDPMPALENVAVQSEPTPAEAAQSIASTLPVGGEVGNQAPEFNGINNWINSEPLTMQELRGQVVLIDFWTYTCINCIRTLPYMKQWYADYADAGLVVVGVHSPEFDFEKKTNNVIDSANQRGLIYPIAQDNQFATWYAYNNRYWPAKYLIDQHGVIRYRHFGEGAYAETERQIRNLLEETGVDLSS